MSGRPSCAFREPSTNSTREWTALCGWTTTEICLRGRPNRWCASISSRPLFIRVAESTVTLGPIDHRGWFNACSTVTWSRSEEHTSELQSRPHLVCRLLLEKKKKH